MKNFIFVCLCISLLTFAQEKEQHQRPVLPSPPELKQLPPDGGPKWNRLVFEASPYLRQHAANPVDWYPWGDEAFQKAKAENKPIFLSIGYSTCHWCHVMEKESFEDKEVAALLNKYFICVKVDREERPDIDEIYMAACQAMTGSGGWPLTAMLTHEKKPFFAGTYFPKNGRAGHPGMMELIPRIGEIWNTQNQRLLTQADQITALVKASSSTMNTGEHSLDKSTLDKALAQLKARYDQKHGGFGKAPKFPTSHNLNFLLRSWQRSGDRAALDMVKTTLTNTRHGGIFDHLGYGFHRYATDELWLLPHFEKMLYDQALIAIAALETYQATNDPFFAQIARDIFTYVLREMTATNGGFYSAEDADTEGEEGLFYLWQTKEIRKLLPKKDADLFIKIYQFKDEGNFVPEVGPAKQQNIPHLKENLQAIAKQEGILVVALEKRLEKIRQKLFTARESRVIPHKDDKILTDWNGLMIAAFAIGGRVLNEPSYTEAAQKAAAFIQSTLTNKQGRLLKRARGNLAGLPAHLNDYAYMTWAYLELYETTFDVAYLKEAIRLGKETITHFWDKDQGGFFFTANDNETLIVRTKEIFDGALPSGNSVSALNFLRLGRITTEAVFEEKAATIFKAFATQLERNPSGATFLMTALDFYVGPSYEIVIAGDLKSIKPMQEAIQKNFIPNKVIVFRPEQQPEEIVALAPYTEGQSARGGKATAYVCRNYACNAPTTEIETMLNLLLKK